MVTLNAGVYVVATKKIAQAPSCDDPDVPKGTKGYVEDVDPYSLEDMGGAIFVDFGEPYGVVMCVESELKRRR